MAGEKNTIDVVVNGSPREIAPSLSVRQLIESLGMGQQAVAAEVNQRLIPRGKQDTHILLPGDRIELVSLVGGG